jgi:hypothetical protein
MPVTRGNFFLALNWYSLAALRCGYMVTALLCEQLAGNL